MLTTEMVQSNLNDLIADFQKAVAKAGRIADAIRKLEEGTGMEFATSWTQVQWPTFPVKRTDLGKIRKVVGRIKVVGRSVPYDYNTKRELSITIQPPIAAGPRIWPICRMM